MEADFGGENRSTKWQELSFAIVGLGLIGGSYAKALRKLGVKQIIGIERDAATLQEAKQQGLVDIGMTEPDNRLKEANVIICAIYPEAIVGFIAANVDFFNESVLLTDVAGIKNDMISLFFSFMALSFLLFYQLVCSKFMSFIDNWMP